MTGPDDDTRLDRRSFLRAAAGFSALGFLPAPLLAAMAEENAGEGRGVFFNPAQMRTLSALCAHYVPGPPDDPDPGAIEAGVPLYIDLLLGAFLVKPLRIHAGGPFSLREIQGAHNAFLDFLPLDALEERSWRTRIEGSRGLEEREWNGPVKGWQQTYVDGLQVLEEEEFVEQSRLRRNLLLYGARGELREFLDLAFQHTLEGMYGAPEYGGNRDCVGWRYTRWPGDQQPRMYTAEEVSLPDADQLEAVERARRNGEDYLS